MNKVILNGNLCKDIELRYTQNSNTASVSNTIAVRNDFKNAKGEYESQFINFVAYRKNAEFLNKLIPYGFDVVTLGGYSLDKKTIDASQKIIERGRKEFHFELDEIIPHIENEVNLIKEVQPDVVVSANVRSTIPHPIKTI